MKIQNYLCTPLCVISHTSLTCCVKNSLSIKKVQRVQYDVATKEINLAENNQNNIANPIEKETISCLALHKKQLKNQSIWPLSLYTNISL